MQVFKWGDSSPVGRKTLHRGKLFGGNRERVPSDFHGPTAGIKTIFRPRRNRPETGIDYRPTHWKLGGAKMIEVAVILGLFCAGIFVAHAVDAYRAH